MPGLRRALLALLVLGSLLLPASSKLPGRPENARPEEGDELERWRWAFEQRAYPIGFLPSDAIPRALEERGGPSPSPTAGASSPRRR
jgi:hypothetical protein